jgi:hypothetical protein
MSFEVYFIIVMFAWFILMLTYKPKNDLKDIIITFIAICIVSWLWPGIVIIASLMIMKAFVKAVSE